MSNTGSYKQSCRYTYIISSNRKKQTILSGVTLQYTRITSIMLRIKRFSAEKIFVLTIIGIPCCNCDNSGLKRNIYEKPAVNMSCLAQTVWAWPITWLTVNARNLVLIIVPESATKNHRTSTSWPFLYFWVSSLTLVTEFQPGSTYNFRVSQKCLIKHFMFLARIVLDGGPLFVFHT